MPEVHVNQPQEAKLNFRPNNVLEGAVDVVEQIRAENQEIRKQLEKDFAEPNKVLAKKKHIALDLKAANERMEDEFKKQNAVFKNVKVNDNFIIVDDEVAGIRYQVDLRDIPMEFVAEAIQDFHLGQPVIGVEVVAELERNPEGGGNHGFKPPIELIDHVEEREFDQVVGLHKIQEIIPFYFLSVDYNNETIQLRNNPHYGENNIIALSLRGSTLENIIAKLFNEIGKQTIIEVE